MKKIIIEKEWNRLDGKWSWVIAAGTFCCMVMISGISMTVGIYHPVFLEAFHGGSGNTAIVSALNFGMMSFIGPICSIVVNRWSIRISIIFGGALTSIGLVMSSFATGIYFLIFSFGLLTGSGLGFVFAATSMAIVVRFERNRGMALGIISAGYAIGICVYPFLIEAAMHAYGWRGSLMLLGGITLNMCACGALIIPAYTPEREPSAQLNTTNNQVLTSETTKCCKLFILNLHCVLFSFGYSAFNTHMPAYGILNIGLSDYATASLVSISGATGALFKLVLGLLLNTPRVNKELLYIACCGVMGAGVACIPLSSTYVQIASLAGLCGAAAAAFGPVLCELTVLYVGVDSYITAYGYICLSSGIGSFLGAPAAGWLYDALEVYQPSFYLGGTFIVVSAAIIFIPYCKKKYDFNTEANAIYKVEHPDAEDPFLGVVGESSL